MTTNASKVKPCDSTGMEVFQNSALQTTFQIMIQDFKIKMWTYFFYMIRATDSQKLECLYEWHVISIITNKLKYTFEDLKWIFWINVK